MSNKYYLLPLGLIRQPPPNSLHSPKSQGFGYKTLHLGGAYNYAILRKIDLDPHGEGTPHTLPHRVWPLSTVRPRSEHTSYAYGKNRMAFSRAPWRNRPLYFSQPQSQIVLIAVYP